MTPSTDLLATASGAPDRERIDYLQSEFVRCSPVSGQWNRIADADNVRYCRWEGQTADGKKHSTRNAPAFPWELASDTRTFTADHVIGERTSLLTSAFWRALIRPKAADDTVGQYAVALADALVNQRLTHELAREVELSASHMETYGWVVLHPCWEQRTGLRRQEVTLQDLVALGAQLAREYPDHPGLADLATLVLDPANEDLAMEELAFVYDHYARGQMEGALEVEIPALSKPVLRSAVRALRREGEADVPVPYLCTNGPAVYALRPWDEVFVPEDTTDLQRARVVFQREWVSEAELRARIVDMEYDKEWVEQAVQTRGRLTRFLAGVQLDMTVDQIYAGNAPGDLIEVIHATYRAVGDDNVPGVYCTTFSTQVKGKTGRPLYARHELVDYPHGQLPYVEGKREHVSRCLTASRGVPELVAWAQNEIKALRDGIIDWTSIGVIPPVNLYKTPFDTKYRFGPAVQNTVLPGKEPRFMDVPSNGMAPALAAMERLDYWVSNYFGLSHPQVPPDRIQTLQARAVQNFLIMWARAIQQMVALAQNYMPDREFARLTGAPDGWLDEHRHRLGILDVELEFDVRELNEELTTKRLEAVNKAVLPSDVQGVVQRNKWVEVQLRAINPAWAKELLVPAAEASQSLYRQVREDIGQMFLGNAPQMVENDPTAQTKLQFTQQIVAANPNYQQALAQPDGRFRQLMEAYAKNLTFSVTQDRNKQVGRIGVSPEAVQ